MPLCGNLDGSSKLFNGVNQKALESAYILLHIFIFLKIVKGFYRLGCRRENTCTDSRRDRNTSHGFRQLILRSLICCLFQQIPANQNKYDDYQKPN